MAGHLGVAADEYDRTIRTFIPDYEQMVSTIVHWLDGHVPPRGLVVDLGAGTGGLARAILDALPDVRVQLVDVDPNMLEVAAARCEAHADRVELRHGAVRGSVAALSRGRRVARAAPRGHARREARALSRRPDCARARRPRRRRRLPRLPGRGGNGERIYEDWYAHMERNGISRPEAEAHFAAWAEEDFYVSLPDELALIGGRGLPASGVLLA